MKESYQFCLSLLSLGRSSQRNLVNILLGLCSMPGLRSVVELSESEFFRFSYSSITKVLTRWECTHEEVSKFVERYISVPILLSNGKTAHCFSHDFTKLLKPESVTLEDRTYLPTNNAVGSKKQFSAGYHVAALHYNSGQSGHCPLYSFKRLDGYENHIEAAKGQIEELMSSSVVREADLSIIKTDAQYGRAAYLVKAYEHKDLLFVCRLQSAINVYTQYKGPQKGKKQRVFGDTFTLISENRLRPWVNPRTQVRGSKLQTSIHHLERDEYQCVESITKSGRRILIEIKRWKDLLFRSFKGCKMEDKPFDVLSITITDAETKETVFDRPMWLCVAGERKDELTSLDAYQQYRQRYGVETTYRFCNQKLLLGSLQTSRKEHLDNWLKIVQLSTWYLYLIASEATLVCKKWQVYTQKNREAKDAANNQKMTMSQAQNSAKTVIRLYDLAAFAPRKANFGKGRTKGTKLLRKSKHKIVRKKELLVKYGKKILEKNR